MYNLSLVNGPIIDVTYRKHTFSYAIDASLPNPLEAFYGALAGCAGVYAKKACKALGIADEGITINLRPIVKAGNPLLPEKIITSVTFPDHFSAESRTAILESISHCAVKEAVKLGADIQFSVLETS